MMFGGQEILAFGIKGVPFLFSASLANYRFLSALGYSGRLDLVSDLELRWLWQRLPAGYSHWTATRKYNQEFTEDRVLLSRSVTGLQMDVHIRGGRGDTDRLNFEVQDGSFPEVLLVKGTTVDAKTGNVHEYFVDLRGLILADIDAVIPSLQGEPSAMAQVEKHFAMGPELVIRRADQAGAAYFSDFVGEKR